MAKAQKPERGAKSRAIREYFSKNPKASIKEAHEGLAAAGHKVSTALVAAIRLMELSGA